MQRPFIAVFLAMAVAACSSSAPIQYYPLPDSAFIREAQLVQSPKRPDSPAPLPFSAPTLWRKVKAGTFPKPHRLSERVTAWKVGDVRAWIASHCATQQVGG